MRHAVAAGIGLIDTAHLYTGGIQRGDVGSAVDGGSRAVSSRPRAASGEGSPEILLSTSEESLRRLRVDQIFLYYLHRVDPETPFETALA